MEMTCDMCGFKEAQSFIEGVDAEGVRLGWDRRWVVVEIGLNRFSMAGERADVCGLDCYMQFCRTVFARL